MSDMQLGDNPNFIKDIIALTGKTSGDTVANTVGQLDSSGIDFQTKLRGLTGDPVDVLLMDDLYKNWKDAKSPLIRENVKEWYISTADSRSQLL